MTTKIEADTQAEGTQSIEVDSKCPYLCTECYTLGCDCCGFYEQFKDLS